MTVEPVRVAATVVDVAVPAGAGRVPGISMAGFRGRTEGPVELQVVPYPALTVFIDFGGAVLVDEAEGERRRGSVVVGIDPGSVRLCVHDNGFGGDVDCLQLRLSPVVAHAVLSAGAAGGRVIGLEELWGRDAERVRERLHAAGSWDERFAIAEGALGRRFEAGRGVDAEVGFAWEQLVASRGRVRVERVADEIGWSRKRLWSRFRAQIGITPKRAATLIRFDHAAHRLAAGDSAAMVAAESGFVDQSHLHRDVMTFAGITPNAMAHAPWLAVDPVAWAAKGI